MQYHHIINSLKPSTIAVEVPLKKELIDLLDPKNTKHLMIKVGYSLLHPNDRYVRKIGREESLKKVFPKTFYIKQVTFNDNTTIFTLRPIDSNFTIKELTFRVNLNYDKVHFIEGKI